MSLPFPIKQQPDETTCGPTCLHTLYEYYKDPVSLDKVIEEADKLEGGGTLGAMLACHALERGYQATIYTYHLRIFDPSWFQNDNHTIIKKLQCRNEYMKDKKLNSVTNAYIRFLELGGKLRFEDLRPGIIRRYLKMNRPVIAGLSATYLYQTKREFGPNLEYDDIRGEPSGHFVVLHGYNPQNRMVSVADPLKENPLSDNLCYEIKIDRIINAILLGNVTYDANMIVISPEKF